MQKEPPPFVWAVPDEKDILICAPGLSHVTDLILIHFLPGNFIIVRLLYASDVLLWLTHHPTFSMAHQIPPT